LKAQRSDWFDIKSKSRVTKLPIPEFIIVKRIEITRKSIIKNKKRNTMKRFKLFLAALAIMSSMASCNSDEEPQPTYDSFFDITLSDVMAKAGSFSESSLDAIQGDPILPEGTILFFQTSDGRFGKMEITHYDFDDNHKMSFRFVTYESDNSGHIFAGSDVATVKGTYKFNLDANQEEIVPMPDFWWDRVIDDYTVFVPKNGATFYRYN
jgi:hypothetical protein